MKMDANKWGWCGLVSMVFGLAAGGLLSPPKFRGAQEEKKDTAPATAPVFAAAALPPEPPPEVPMEAYEDNGSELEAVQAAGEDTPDMTTADPEEAPAAASATQCNSPFPIGPPTPEHAEACGERAFGIIRNAPFLPLHETPEIPRYKSRMVEQDHWAEFNAALVSKVRKEYADFEDMELPLAVHNKLFAYREIFAGEGGMKRPPKLKKKVKEKGKTKTRIITLTARAGIMDFTLKTQLPNDKRPEVQDLVRAFRKKKSTLDLTPSDIVDLYDYDFGRRFSAVGGIDAALSDINPFAIAALMDTVFRHGNTGGARMAADALDRMNEGREGYTPLGQPKGITQELFDAYREAANNPATLPRLLSELAQSRMELGRIQGRGEKYRFYHFEKFAGLVEQPPMQYVFPAPSRG